MPIDSPAEAEIQVSGLLAMPQAVAVLDLVQRAADEDGVGPLSEHVMLHLRYGGDPRARNLLIWRDGRLAGYGHLDPTDPVAGPSGEMVIDPAFRRQGLGRGLVRALIAEAGDRELRLWAHGDLPTATRLAVSAGFERTRSLWQMRRSLQSRLGQPQLADGIGVRPFQVGQDEDAWIELNHKAFARHPEQGGWARADLDLREREPWFDPAGFFLAERDGRLVGFHWTKIHGQSNPVGEHYRPGGPPDPGHETAHDGHGPGAIGEHADDGGGDANASGHGHDAIGEVYVVGVDPDERGSGLGRALTVVGLRYLRSRGLSQVMLYVDEENAPAIRLYESLGFAHWDTDVMFTRQPQPSA